MNKLRKSVLEANLTNYGPHYLKKKKETLFFVVS